MNQNISFENAAPVTKKHIDPVQLGEGQFDRPPTLSGHPVLKMDLKLVKNLTFDIALR